LTDGGPLNIPIDPSVQAGIDFFNQALTDAGADLAGTGTGNYWVSIGADGSYNVAIDFDNDGRLEYSYSRNGDGSYSLYVDMYNPAAGTSDLRGTADGNPELEETFTPGATPVWVQTIDGDLDGKLDTRITTTADLAVGTEVVVMERDPSETGNFAVVSTITRGTTGLAHCEPTSTSPVPDPGDPSNPATPPPGSGGPAPSASPRTGWPSDGTLRQIPGIPNISIVTSGSDSDVGGACSTPHADQIAAAVACAVGQNGGLNCLETMNTNEAEKVRQAAYGRFFGSTPLQISCSWTSSVANTEGYPWSCNSVLGGIPDCISRTAINPASWDSSPGNQCATILHELMHWAGDPGAANHNDPNFDGSDPVYGCSKYCGGCAAGPTPNKNGTTSSQDCANCADTPSRALSCGAQAAETQEDCTSFALIGNCGGGTGCFSDAPDQCEFINLSDCNGKLKSCGTSPFCGTSCPSGTGGAVCTVESWFACGSSVSSSTCDQGSTPPACPGQ
jgi:hypothetical protein